MTTKYPSSFARFYDTIYHSIRDGVDNEYFLDQIKHTGGKVLEIGVGTGRLFTGALRQGADIYGLDVSESMLEVLLSKLPPEMHHRLSLQNIIDFSYDFRFDLIVAPFRVIMHLMDKSDQIRALNNVYDHLNAGGRFIFDVFVPDLNQILKGLENRMDFEGEYEPGKVVRRYVSTTPDLINQVIEVSFHLEWEEGDGLKHDYWKLPMRFFFRYEMEHLIERSKFKEYKILGDYNGGELKGDSREFIMVCRK